MRGRDGGSCVQYKREAIKGGDYSDQKQDIDPPREAGNGTTSCAP